jgi:hypothetical protein
MPIRRLPEGSDYDPNRVLDAIIRKLRLKNDAALSRVLEVAPPVISKIPTTPCRSAPPSCCACTRCPTTASANCAR